MANVLLTTIRDLHRRRGRERRGLTLAEGVRLIEEALAAAVPLEGVVLSPSLESSARGRALVLALNQAGVPAERVSDAELAKLADTDHPQGVIAVVRPPQWSLSDLGCGARDVVLVLDGVQDPGNTGTILRTALGLGAAALVALPGTAELTNPKVVRGSMGALFRFPAMALDVEQFLVWARERSVQILVADMSGTAIDGRSINGPIALVLGNEGAGVGAVLREAGRVVGVPLAPGAESLNVAVAAGILLYEVMRER